MYLILCFVFISGALYLLFFGVGTDSESGDALAQIIKLPAYIYGIYFSFLKPSKIVKTCTRSPTIILLILLCFASALWSIDPGTSLRRAFLLFLTTLFAIAVATRVTGIVFFRIISISCISIVFIQVLGAAVVPSIAVHQDQHYPAVRGFFAQKNIAGRTLLLGLFSGLMLYASGTSRKLAVITISLCLMGIGLTLSATAILSSIAMIALYLILGRIERSRLTGLAFVTVIFLIILAITALGSATASLGEIVESSGRDMTFTGRTLIWAALIDTILSNNYWLGFGYEAFWGAANGSLKVNWGMWSFIPPHAHNGFLQTWTSLGFIGLVTLNIALLQFGVKAIKSLYSSKDSVRRANLLFLPLVIIVNITEFSFLAYGNIIWIIFIYLAFSCRPVSNKNR